MIERLRAWWKRYRHEQLRAHQRAHGLYIMDLAPTPIARTSRPMAPLPVPPPIKVEVTVMHRCPHCGGEVRFDELGDF